jgi:hypothetical protein
MKVKYNKFLQIGAFVIGVNTVAKLTLWAVDKVDFIPNPAEPLPVLAGLLGIGIIGMAYGSALNNLIINNLKKDQDGTPIIDLNWNKTKPKMR